MKRALLVLLFLFAGVVDAIARDDLAEVRTADGMKFNYVLTTNQPGNVAYAVILMPGGGGQMNPRMEGTKLTFAFGGNFLIRSRALFADSRFVAASTDATSTPARIQAIATDLKKRFGNPAIYVVGTSNSTNATLVLAETMDGQVAGFIHTSSFNRISSFDPRKLKSRNLIVVHEKDVCRFTLPSNGQASNKKYGTELIVMEGGKSTGDECEALAYHGYNGIERETVTRIKEWIARGG
jgi:hypothetical protein